MQTDCDVALLGTGVAPLVAAARLLSQGKSVMILNPDWDFFQEDSELPLDPIWPVTPDILSPARLSQNSAAHALNALRPDFPGPIEFWSPREGQSSKAGRAQYHDPHAPHVRSRPRLWARSGEGAADWELFEAMYVEASDAGLNPQLLEGPQVARSFPGHSSKNREDLRGILLPDFSDVDVDRYRNGLLEYVRERVDSSNIVLSATQVEIVSGGIRYYSGQSGPKGWKTTRLSEGLLVFWTPRLTRWLLSCFDAQKLLQARQTEGRVNVWEEWSLVSRDPIDPATVGVFDQMIVWGESEGSPKTGNLLTVLKPGQSFSVLDPEMRSLGNSWASQESFASLSKLSRSFLGWDRVTIRAMRPRIIFSWEKPGSYKMDHPDARIWVVRGCDGPLVDVVRHARNSVELIQ